MNVENYARVSLLKKKEQKKPMERKNIEQLQRYIFCSIMLKRERYLLNFFAQKQQQQTFHVHLYSFLWLFALSLTLFSFVFLSFFGIQRRGRRFLYHLFPPLPCTWEKKRLTSLSLFISRNFKGVLFVKAAASARISSYPLVIRRRVIFLFTIHLNVIA